jgi:hypothetical protein
VVLLRRDQSLPDRLIGAIQQEVSLTQELLQVGPPNLLELGSRTLNGS